jgi:hypothetical protein
LGITRQFVLSPSKLQVWLAGVWQRTGCSRSHSTERDALKINPYDVSLGRVLIFEFRSFYQRMKFARERLAAPRRIELALLCQSCAVLGDRCCYRNIGLCTHHMQELRSVYPWIGWAEMALLVETWRLALDTACCNQGSARTLREDYHRSLDVNRADATTTEQAKS